MDALSLSDRSILLPVHAEQLCATLSTNHHTFGNLSGKGGSHPLVSPVLSLVDVHAAPPAAAPLTSVDAVTGVDPGREAGPYTTG